MVVDVPQTFHLYTLMKQILIALNRWFAGWETQFTPGELERLLRGERARGAAHLRRLDGARARVPRAARGAQARRCGSRCRSSRAGRAGGRRGWDAPARAAARAAAGRSTPATSSAPWPRSRERARRHLLAINFRDPAHPEAGGAELHLEEILLEAVRRGWRVTWLACGFPGGAPEAEHRGMRVVRRGNWWNFNLVRARACCGASSRDPAPDLVVEDINKVPCFAPWWTRAPVAAIVPHLFGTTAFREASVAGRDLRRAARVAHPVRLPRARRFVAISESTRDDLVRARHRRASASPWCTAAWTTRRYRHDPAVREERRARRSSSSGGCAATRAWTG